MLALVFPGQGCQVVGMGRSLADYSPAARETFAQADAAVGEPLSKLVWEGPADRLQLTENAQPAILTVAIATWRALRYAQPALAPVVAAGHSLGEYAALVAAGVLEFADAVRLVRLRGRAMQQAVPAGRGAMVAVLGLDPKKVREVAAATTTAAEPLAVAGYNTADQTTISGSLAAVEKATALLKAAGARRVQLLDVSAPFHCPLMKPVEAPLGAALGKVAWGRFAFPVVSNVEATPLDDPDRVPELLVRQLTQPVLWLESVRAMRARGADRFVECGPGRTLSAVIKRIDSTVRTVPVSDPDSLESALKAFG